MADIELETTGKIVEGAIAAARDLDILISVAVVDATGHVKHVVRMDGAGWFTPQIAMGKAYAAAAMGRDTEEQVERLQEKQLFGNALAALSGGKLVLGQGGCVLRTGIATIGAVGISGGTSEQDSTCAKAGMAHAGLAEE